MAIALTAIYNARGLPLTLKAYRAESYVEPPKQVICSDRYNDLTRQQLDQAVIAFVHAANLSGGSIGDTDMYKLVHAYFWNAQARAEINKIVGR